MNKLRFRSGQVQLRKVRVEAATAIEAGDLIWLDGDSAKPASEFPWTTNLTTTQSNFAAQFLGVAHQPSRQGETLPVSVDVSPEAVYEFDVNQAVYELGQTLGPDNSGNSLLNKQLEAADATSSIARAAEYATTPATTLRVTFASAYSTMSANVNAGLG